MATLTGKILSKAYCMPDIYQFFKISEPKPYVNGQPVAMISLDTFSPECVNLGKYYLKLQEKFKGIHFVQISFQKYDELINTFSRIPELLHLNVRHDESGVFWKFMSDYHASSTPHMFVFNEKGTLLCDSHPQNPKLLSQFNQLKGKSALDNTFRVPRPLKQDIFDGSDLYNIDKLNQAQVYSPSRTKSPIRGLLRAPLTKLLQYQDGCNEDSSK